jgi:hypothetical protein
MLQRDYILELIRQFVDALRAPLVKACLDGDPKATRQAEGAVAELLQLDRKTALALSPESLVTVMMLSGIADSTASYVAYALERIADAYTVQDKSAKAKLRRQQAVAVANAFYVRLDQIPPELEDTNKEILDGLYKKAQEEAEAAARAAKAKAAQAARNAGSTGESPTA